MERVFAAHVLYICRLMHGYNLPFCADILQNVGKYLFGTIVHFQLLSGSRFVRVRLLELRMAGVSEFIPLTPWS